MRFQPGLDIKTAKISKYWDAGKHTTTYSQMHALDAVGGHIIDTPGIRVFRLFGINKAELRDLFPSSFPTTASVASPIVRTIMSRSARSSTPSRRARSR